MSLFAPESGIEARGEDRVENLQQVAVLLAPVERPLQFC